MGTGMTVTKMNLIKNVIPVYCNIVRNHIEQYYIITLCKKAHLNINNQRWSENIKK